MTEIVPEIARKIAEKVYKGEYPAVLDAVRRHLDYLAVRIINGIHSATMRLNDAGIFTELNVDKKLFDDGFEIRVRVKVVGIDPIKFDVIRSTIGRTTSGTAFDTIAKSEMLIDMIKEEVIKYLEEKMKEEEKKNQKTSS